MAASARELGPCLRCSQNSSRVTCHASLACSLHGISHNKIENTKEEHLAMAVTAFDALADKAIKWIDSR